MSDGPSWSTLVQITCRGVLTHGQQTELLGEVADDAELADLRRRIRGAGLVLVSLRELSDEPRREDV